MAAFKQMRSNLNALASLRALAHRVPDAVQRPSRSSAEPGPKIFGGVRGPRIGSTTPQERRAAQRPGHTGFKKKARVKRAFE
jgi:hypothetical protein